MQTRYSNLEDLNQLDKKNVAGYITSIINDSADQVRYRERNLPTHQKSRYVYVKADFVMDYITHLSTEDMTNLLICTRMYQTLITDLIAYKKEQDIAKAERDKTHKYPVTID